MIVSILIENYNINMKNDFGWYVMNSNFACCEQIIS